MVSSLDGFIAKADGDISWMQSHDHYPAGVTLSDADIAAFLEKIDCYVMGARTYAPALQLGWPYGDVPVFVLTHRKLERTRENVEFYAGDLEKLVQERLKANYENIWLVGGASLAKDFLRQQLVDELVISMLPVLLGSGLRFFDDIRQEQNLHLKDVTAYKDGMVELSYTVVKV